MAQVDFSNAVIQPFNANNYNPIRRGHVSFDLLGNGVTDVNGTQIVSAFSSSNSDETKDGFLSTMTGTFNTSGTEMYLFNNEIHWKISNITFNSGDVFLLKVQVEMTTN